ncbi:MAG: HDOD domain-containing protein [Sulfurimonas sp.]|nr:HDOD domain-containing protein [Sulfurimonas sp.]
MVENIDSLPPLSDVANLVNSIYTSRSDDGNMSKLIRIIESDAILTANILKMINSPYYGFSKKINSISQAVMLFGTHKIYALVISYSMQESLKANTDIYGFNSIQFNEMCHLQSALIMQWYSKVNMRDAQFLAPLVLMMESGKLILANEVVKSDYSDIFRKSFIECENIEEFEKELIENTSYYISALLFEHWNLEPIYVEILKELDLQNECDRNIQVFKEIIKVIRTAINLKEILTEESIKKASRIVWGMNLSVDNFEKVANGIREAYINAS